MIESLLQFGVAGLMGALWVWERTHSRKRERQLDEAHDRLVAQDRQLGVLIRLVRQNTKAMVGFERVQARVIELMQTQRRQQSNGDRP